MEPLMSRFQASRQFERTPRVRRDDPEPSIRELLADPVLQLLMTRDRVGRTELLDLVDDARVRLGLDTPSAAAAFEATLFAECRA
jgi:hypothetical protein